MQKMDVRKAESLEIRNYLDGHYREQMAREISEGFNCRQKSIPCKYFYDYYGSWLFEQICCTPEYYLTKSELSILDSAAHEIMEFFAEDGGDLLELGSGSNMKIRKLLDIVDEEDLSEIRYVPVDISKPSLKKTTNELKRTYKKLKVLGIVADFTRHLNMVPWGRKLILFFGSTIGNFEEKEAVAFLKNISEIMTFEDRFLLGLDMLKPASIMEAAYNDKRGVTEKFNLNILSHINRKLNADFNLDDFNHLAYFDPEKERIEMHLEVKRTVRVQIQDLSLSVDFKKGETIHTELCKKYSKESASRMFMKAGLSEESWFTDPNEWFSLVKLRTTNNT